MFWYFSKPFYGGIAETTKKEMRGGLTVRSRRKEKKVRRRGEEVRRGKERGEEVGTVVAAVVAEWESEGRESEGWLKVKNEKINLRLKVIEILF